jgi:hypothetical protein
MGSRRHFDPQTSNEVSWKPCLKVAHDKYKERPVKATGTKKLDPDFSASVRPRPERRHTEAGGQTTNTWEDIPTGRATFVGIHNRKTQDTVDVEKRMGTKIRVTTTFEARNGLPMVSLGDKIYKAPEYQPGFFREGGLVPGST